MSKDKRKIAVFTSGGDCSGLNAVIRAVTKRAIDGYGWRVFGIKDGLMGFLNDPPLYTELHNQSVDFPLFRSAGTFLGTTNKDNPFAFTMPNGEVLDRSQEIISAYQKLGLDGIVAIGGDGSLKMMNHLIQSGPINLVAVPKTIDNDIGATEYSVGFNTSVGIATEALDRLQPTAASHKRVMILEVMGRDAGHIALSAGIAGGADIILIPEMPYKLENIIKKIKKIKNEGRDYALIIVAEGVKKADGQHATITFQNTQERYRGIGEYIGQYITETLNIETRVSNLGHIQRGGTPTFTDRIIASAFGVFAVDLIAQNKFGQMVTWHNHKISSKPISESIASYHLVKEDCDLIKTALGLDICLG